jgi:hypothetical protein
MAIDIAAVALGVTAAMFVLPGGREFATRLGTGWFAPQFAGVDVDEDAEVESWKVLGSALAGRIVWSSNRSGNHELCLLELPTGRAEQLTDHPNVDFGARFSPDGGSVVFMRSRRECVSFRETDAWDVMLLDLGSGRERRLARRGYHPTWGPVARASSSCAVL